VTDMCVKENKYLKALHTYIMCTLTVFFNAFVSTFAQYLSIFVFMGLSYILHFIVTTCNIEVRGWDCRN
jgi:hypothetical protein